jgi:hypothetical protein
MTVPIKRSKLARLAKPTPSDSDCRMKGSKSPAANADDNVTRSNACPLVMIEWEDSAQPIPAWQLLSDFEGGETLRCASVGWLIRDDAEMKAVAPNMGAVNHENSVQVSGVIRIPTRCVLKVTRLSEPCLTA